MCTFHKLQSTHIMRGSLMQAGIVKYLENLLPTRCFSSHSTCSSYSRTQKMSFHIQTKYPPAGDRTQLIGTICQEGFQFTCQIYVLITWERIGNCNNQKSGSQAKSCIKWTPEDTNIDQITLFPVKDGVTYCDCVRHWINKNASLFPLCAKVFTL